MLNTLLMPRNEEEIMRHMLILASQIKYINDLPQVFITFDEQTYVHLYFNVIVVRLLKSNSCSIADLFTQKEKRIEYLHERTKLMGCVRKKYMKEATVFRLRLSKKDFLRADHSIHLYQARQVIVDDLSKKLGKIRDYNGGILVTQHEFLSSVRYSLANVKNYSEILLENFFIL